MEVKDQGWLIFKTDQGWEMKTVSNAEDLIFASEGTYWLKPNGMPRAKAEWANWNYVFHQLPPQVLTWATLLQAQTLPINHHDPHHNPKSHKPEPKPDSTVSEPLTTYPLRHVYRPKPDTSSNH